MDFISLKENYILLKIQVIPGAKKNEITGIIGDAEVRLKIKINALPEDGKANKEIIAFLSKTLKISKGSFEILRGEQSRQKDIILSNDFDILEIRKKLIESINR